MSDTLYAFSLLVIAVKIVIVVVVCCRRAQGGTETVLPEFLTVTMHKFFSDMEREKPIRFSSEQLMIATCNFTNLLGSGAFGAVYKGIFTNGVSVAVKVLNGSSDKRIEEQFMAEVSTIGRTHHFNLLRLYGFCFDRNLRALVYEFMPNGSLDRFLFQENKVIEFMKLHDIATGTAKGIAYLHEECQQRIIHYDIKPGNILLDANFTPKVADFGLAKLSSRENTHITMTGGRGTPGYAAPELWMPFPVSQKCDVYSFGMLLFEIIGKRRNLDVTLPDSQEWFPRWVWKKFENGELVNLRAVCSIEEKDRELAERMIKVALWCVQYQPAARPLMSVVVKMLEGGVDIPMPVNPFQHLYIGTSNLVVGSPCPDLLTSGTWTQSWSGPISSNMVAGPSYQNATATPVMRKYEIEIVST